MEKRVYNFSAGPSMLPLSALERAGAEITNYAGSGMSVMEMSEDLVGAAVAAAQGPAGGGGDHQLRRFWYVGHGDVPPLQGVPEDL